MSEAEVRIRRFQTVQTQNMFDLVISGNTVGAGTALVSSGTLTLAGGIGISLSQDLGNAITIQGSSTLNESQITFDTLNGHQHDGIDSRLIIIPEYVEVSKTEVGKSRKQFTSVGAALASILDNSSSKPYIIKVYPGIYTESPFSMKPYVSIEGTEMYGVTIQTNDNTNHFITGSANSYIRNVTIIGPTNANQAAVYYTDQAPATTAPFVLQDILIRRGYFGVWCNPTVSTSVVHLINVNNWYSSGGVQMNTFARSTGFGVIVAQASGFMCGAPDAITTGFEANGANSELYLFACYFRNTPGVNSITGLYVDNGGYVILSSCTFSRGSTALWIGPNGTGGKVYTAANVIRNDTTYFFTTDIKIDNAAASMHYSGIASRTKLSIVAGATFNGNFTDVTIGAEGTVNLGEFYIGDLLNQLPLRDYGFTTYLTGQKSGGEVTTTGLLGVNVAPGAGFINTSPGVNAVKAIVWLNTNFNIAANTREWIYVDSSGVVQHSNVEPDELTNIALGVAYANATDVVFLAIYARKLQGWIGKIDDYTEDGIGTIWIEDSAAGNLSVTENVGTPLKLDVTSGEYFRNIETQSPIGGVGITFTYWFGSDIGGWTTVPGSVSIDNLQYDNAGMLTAMGAGKWKKDVLYVNVNSNLLTTQYHVVYGQAQYDTQADAENAANPVPPSWVGTYGLRLAGIIVQKSSANINKILDLKPVAHYTKPGHNTLFGLQGGNSVGLGQYYHLDSGQFAGVGSKIIAISGSNSSISGSTITFGNLNNVSFYVTNGSVVGSFAGGIASAVQELNGSSGTMSISGSQNITAQNNNSTISLYGPANILNSFSVGGNTGTTGSSAISGGGFVIAGGNNITLSQSNATISINAANQSVQTENLHNVTVSGNSSSSGATGFAEISSGTMTLLGGNNITLQQDGNRILISAFNQSVEPRVISLNGTSGSLSLSGASNITVSALNGSTITIYGPANILNSLSISGNTGTTGSSNITGGGFVIAGGNNITLSQSNNTISIYGAAAGTGAAINAIAAGTVTATSGTVAFSDANNVTFGMDTNYNITASASFAATGSGIAAIAANGTSFTSGTVVFSDFNNVSFGTSGAGAQQTITATASYSQSVQTQSIVGVNIIGNTSGTNYTYTQGVFAISGGNNITLSQNSSNTSVLVVSAASTSQSVQPAITAVVASNITYTTGSVQFTGAGAVTVSAGATNTPITINAPVQSVQTQNLHALALFNNTSGNITIGTSGTVSLAGTNITITANTANNSNIGFSVAAQSVQPAITAVVASNITYTTGSVQFTGAGIITVSAAATNLPISISATQSVQTQSVIGINIIGNTSGTNYTYTQGVFAISGGNNITLSQNSSNTSVLVISAAPAGAGAGHGLVVSNNTSGATTIGTSGTVSFAATNVTITVDTANNSILGYSVANPGILSIFGSTTRATSGEVVFGNANNITFGMNANTMTASYSQTLQTSGLHALVVSNNTSGATTIGTSGTVSFAATNITITANTANNSIIGYSVANPTFLAEGTNITLSSNSNSISIIGPTNILNSLSVSGNTGTTGSSNITGGGFVLAGGSNITLSQSNNTISIHAQSDSVQPRVISLNGTSGSLSLVGASNITVSALNGSTITIYGPSNILNSLTISGNSATTGSSNITGGGFVLAGGSNITLEQSNNTISISAAAAGGGVAIKFFNPAPMVDLTSAGIDPVDVNSIYFQRIYVPASITATQYDVIVNLSGASNSSGAYTFSYGLYTMDGSTANILSSNTFAKSFASGTATSGTGVYGGNSGRRFRSGTIASWAFTPGDYYFALGAKTAGAATMTLIGPHRISVQPNIGGGNYTPYFFDGVYTATSAALPASIQLTDVSRTGDNIKVWWFGLIGAL